MKNWLFASLALLLVATLHGEARAAHRHHFVHRSVATAPDSPWDWWRRGAQWSGGAGESAGTTLDNAFSPVVHLGMQVSGLSSECRQAARLGGPCGCFASEHFFGHSVRDLWLARNWFKFPRTSPAPGTAAIFGHGYHVAPVVGVEGDRVIVQDSWATHAVRMSGLTFVSPR